MISYDVSRRSNEIGIRTALGARPADVRRLIVGKARGLAACGIGAGRGGRVRADAADGQLLYGVRLPTPGRSRYGPLLLGAVALLASYIPSRRAMALDPMAALRHE